MAVAFSQLSGPAKNEATPLGVAPASRGGGNNRDGSRFYWLATEVAYPVASGPGLPLPPNPLPGPQGGRIVTTLHTLGDNCERCEHDE